MSIFVTDTAKTKAKATLQKRRNLFGLGVTSLIAACAGDEAGGGGGKVIINQGVRGGSTIDLGKIPENPVPAKLSATQLAEASIERLAPVADDNGYITASASDPDSTRNNLKNLVVTIDAASGLVDSNFEMTFKNGNHTENSANPDDPVNHFASVYQLAEDTYDLVVTSADFANSSNAKRGAIYVVLDIKERPNLDDTDAAASNFLRILGTSGNLIGQYEPNFFHIDNDNQYDMIFGADYTDSINSNQYTNMYIFWDVSQYAGKFLNIDTALTYFPSSSSSSSTFSLLKLFQSANGENINRYLPEFLHIGGNDAQYDMIIRGVREGSGSDSIYIVWDVANDNEHISLGRQVANKVILINPTKASDKIASYPPELFHVGGDPQYDLVIRSDVVTDDNNNSTGGIFILWDVAKHIGATSGIILGTSGNYNLLRIFGEAENKKIGQYSPEFLQIGGVGDTDNSNAPQQDMIIRSNDDTTIYILWDVAAYYDSTSLATPVTVNLGGGSITNGLLKITAGENVGEYSPEFLQIGGTVGAGHDMVIRSNTAIYVLWDVAAYYDSGDLTTSVDVNLSSNSAAKGLLKITGTVPGEEIGSSNPDILKINNNGDYDMIIKSNTNMYVLWDFTKDYSTTPASVSLTDASAATGNGLLTISGAGTANILKDDSTGFADIDGKGINDIVFTYESNTFILFGEKVADRDTNEKAISHEVNLAAISFVDGVAGFFTADAVTTVAADAIGYRYANDDLDTLADVQGNPPSFSLSDADAVWDIA